VPTIPLPTPMIRLSRRSVPFARLARGVAATMLAIVPAAASAQATRPNDATLAHALAFRNIGPALMGGRLTSIAPVPNASGQPGTVFIVGAATGGVWRTENAGVSWTPIFDSVGTGGVGAVAVAPSDPDVIWVGTGEANNMRSSSWGTGVYKTADGGKTWSGAMLPTSQHIGRIVVDPRDPNVAYVAALGPLWAPGGERGLYKTTDGGKTWVTTKAISPYTGFTDVVMDPSNPDVLYAASEERERREYGFLPAGPEAGIFKTTDGAKTWTKLAEGLPTGEIGRIGLSICASRPATVYAIISAKGDMNGTYRSDDRGDHWRRVNAVDGTAWYYSQIICDPVDPEHVITLNAASRQSWDGGKTWQGFAQGGVHSDHHALWINPVNPQQQLLGGDGGLYLTWDRGQTWDHMENFVISQFYTVAVDDARPFYHVYGGLQDNQTFAGPSGTRDRYGPTNAMWFRMSGGDGFYAVPDPNDWHLIYAESQQAGVQRYDERTGESKSIRPTGPHGEHLRFNWSTPILPSTHARNTVYLAAQYVFKSANRGDSWTMISPDLTRNIDRNTLPMRGAVPDSGTLGRNEGTAEFGNITTIDESPLKAGLLAVGTDDGVIQVSTNDGKTWNRYDTFPSVPDTTYVSRVTWSSANEGRLYATFDGHRSNDFTPYVLVSEDYGKTWKAIASNLPAMSGVEVVREHPSQPNLLFVGTEFGAFFSIDRGGHWSQLTGDLPAVPVWDMKIQTREHDLVLATHGRGIWIMDDITPLAQLATAKRAPVAYLFPVRDQLLYQPDNSHNSGMGTSGYEGANPPYGAIITYLTVGGEVGQSDSQTVGQSVRLDILDASGTIVRTLPLAADDKTAGMHRVAWDMRAGPPLTGPVPSDSELAARAKAGRGGRGGGGGGGFGGFGGRGGEITYPVTPGRYTAQLTVKPASGAAVVLTQSFTLTKDDAQVMAASELRSLDQFRHGLADFEASLRDAQARVDSAQRAFTPLKTAADAAEDRLTPALKTQLAAVDSAFTHLYCDVGSAAGGGGRGARGGGRGGAAGGIRCPGQGGFGGAEDNTPDTPPERTIQQKVQGMSYLLNVTFNPTAEQQSDLRGLPADLKKQEAALATLRNKDIPALEAALKAGGVDLTPPARGRGRGRGARGG